MTLLLRKLLASSTFAIAGALTTVANRLRAKVGVQYQITPSAEDVDQDYEALDDTAEKWPDDAPSEPLSETDRAALEREIADLDAFARLASSYREGSTPCRVKEVVRDCPPCERHRWPPEPAPAPAPSVGDPASDHGNHSARQGTRRHRRAAHHPRGLPSGADSERDFPSLCFALATGVGKTRLMGAFMSDLHQAQGIDNFFVLAPNLTICNKLIADFTPNTPKYVFRGIAEFATNKPMVITGDNYEQQNVTGAGLFGTARITIFNISKINSQVRGGKAPRI